MNANRKVGFTGSDSSIYNTDSRFIARIVISKVLEIPPNIRSLLQWTPMIVF
jgi:hypothetical protein